MKNTQDKKPLKIALIGSEMSEYVLKHVAKDSLTYTNVGSKDSTFQKTVSSLLDSSYQSFIVDLDALLDAPEVIGAELLRLKTASEKPVVLFASGYSFDEPLVTNLRMNGFTQWIVSKNLSTMYQQMEEYSVPLVKTQKSKTS